MKVSVRFYAMSRDLAGASERELELPSGTTLSIALEQLFQDVPALKVLRTSSLFAVGLDYVSHDTVLEAGNVISFIPPVQGG
ncbi:MAG: MoaD/ThiS family protein [Candidatus Kapaibacterium sp.]|jgi:molybdopterin converting factor small subunit